DPLFSTHLIPVRRGILSGIYARVVAGTQTSDIEAAYAKYYGSYPLTKVGALSTPNNERSDRSDLALKKVTGSARTHIRFKLTGEKLYVFSLIDNLLKGAASQAIENFNRLHDLPVETALTELEGLL
ncbi:MAG: hypothetical protein HY075_14120, partial [Deltaproteobacteria bacterium]|nr:hypothetical protein [Deltaproteobacteria bacterium]